MKKLKITVIHALFISLLLLTGTPASALETFEQAGQITDLGYDKFEVHGKSYRIAPGAKLRSNDTKRKSFADFKEGDHIWFQGKVLNGVNYVDIISYETPEPS